MHYHFWKHQEPGPDSSSPSLRSSSAAYRDDQDIHFGAGEKGILVECNGATELYSNQAGYEEDLLPGQPVCFAAEFPYKVAFLADGRGAH